MLNRIVRSKRDDLHRMSVTLRRVQRQRLHVVREKLCSFDRQKMRPELPRWSLLRHPDPQLRRVSRDLLDLRRTETEPMRAL